MRTASSMAFASKCKAMHDCSCLKSVWLLDIETQEALFKFRNVLEILLNRSAEFGGCTSNTCRDREHLAQTVHCGDCCADCMSYLKNDCLLSDFRSDVGVTVAVSTDPCTKCQRTSSDWKVDIETLEFASKVVENFRNCICCKVIEVIQRVHRFIKRFRAIKAEFIGLPQEIHSLCKAFILCHRLRSIKK
ncbi:unannotated protein [freshwater metagenome]|uniref:Unannotated protein n=1 Tax=freshwater metagenome TaxID=449393 RepID=A0A6J6XI71_9ZZZZ